MRQYILTQDIGVLSCKATLYTLEGEIVRSNIISYRAQTGNNRWAWQSPALWWDAYCQNCLMLLSGIEPEEVVAVSLCGQMMGCLPVDSTCTPLCDSIIWGDSRAIPQAEKLASRLGVEHLHHITGIHCSPTFSTPKMMWIRENWPDIYQKTYKFIQTKDYINFRLTGQLVTDISDAGFTQAYDLFNNCWSEEILTAAGIDPSKMPEVVPHGTVLGHVTQKASEECGLSTCTLVIQGVGDGRATVVGSGIQKPGEGCIYLGAAAWVSQVTTTRNMDPECRLSKTSYLYPNLYTNGGAMLAGRLCADWFIQEFFSEKFSDSLSDENTYRFVDEQVARSKVGSNGLLFLPYLVGERAPWWNTEAKGGFLGLRSSHTKYDFFRSILEGVSFNLGIIKNSIEQLETFTNIRMVGEGSNPQWQQIIADVFDRPIISTNVTWEVGCVGVAAIAGVGAGVYRDFSDINRFHKINRITSPIQENVEIYRELLPAFEDCYYALKDINQHLGNF